MTDPITRRNVVRGRTGPTGPIGVPIQNPLANLEMNEEVALYVGLLEGQLAAYAINEAKYRALLEMLTGEAWNSTMVDVDSNALVDIASQALVRRGMDGVKARTTVMKRFQQRESAIPEPTQPISEDMPESMTMEERFQSWQKRRRPQISNAPTDLPDFTQSVEPESEETQDLSQLPPVIAARIKQIQAEREAERAAAEENLPEENGPNIGSSEAVERVRQAAKRIEDIVPQQDSGEKKHRKK